MIDETCIFTIGDFATLKTLQEDWSARGHELAPALRRKLHEATVVFQSDLPRDVASLGSQVAYSIDAEAFTHTLTCSAHIDHRWLPIGLRPGLALIGQREGSGMLIRSEQNELQRVELHRVVNQPEANWPDRFTSTAAALPR